MLILDLTRNNKRQATMQSLTEPQLQFLSTVAVSIVSTMISVINKLAIADFPHSPCWYVYTSPFWQKIRRTFIEKSSYIFPNGFSYIS